MYSEAMRRKTIAGHTLRAVTPDELKGRCLEMPMAEETFPFNPETSVFKIAGKVFAISRLGKEPLDVSVKCEPELGETLRETHESIVPGYHLNKLHWITITINREVTDDRVRELIEDSYDLVKPRPRKG
jgi:predicted DNA-binding protein (MmcQ/YjbR family)